MKRLVVVLLVACTGSSSSPPDNPDASIARDAPTITPDAAWPQVAKVGGVIAIAERVGFCEQLSQCSDLTYTECIEAVDHAATVQRAITGCTSTAKLESVIACARANNICASTACDASLTAWGQAYASANCEVKVSSVGIGDRFEIFSGADSQCDGGVRAGGGWCTRACSNAQTCAGKANGGKNHFGTLNTCAHETFIGGFGCYPTCTSTAHCQAWFGEMRNGARIACKKFDDGSAPEPICVRVVDNRGVELP
jgi:hypothetical protein